MLARMRHPSARHVADAIKPTADPTGTFDIRRRYQTLLDIRWRKFLSAVRMVLVEQDMLGLRPDKPTTLGLALSALTPDGKTKAFQVWTDSTLNRIVLENDTAFLDPMIAATYRRGLLRAQRLSKAVVNPNMADVIANLQQLTLVEMQGIVEAVSQRMVRVAANAQLDFARPQDVVKEMQKAIETIGITRSRQVVSIMVIKTHSQATLDTFAYAGVKRVGLLSETVRPKRLVRTTRDARTGVGSRMSRTKTPSGSTIGRLIKQALGIEEQFAGTEVEVQTAGDDLVCPECEEISADGPYTIDEARSLIPAHPECRCTFVPEDDAAFQLQEEE